MANVTMKQGDKSLVVNEATFEGVSALEHLGWKLESGKKPARVKRAEKPVAVDVDQVRAEVEAELREQIEAEVRAEIEAEQAKADEDAAKADPKK